MVEERKSAREILVRRRCKRQTMAGYTPIENGDKARGNSQNQSKGSGVQDAYVYSLNHGGGWESSFAAGQLHSQLNLRILRLNEGIYAQESIDAGWPRGPLPWEADWPRGLLPRGDDHTGSTSSLECIETTGGEPSNLIMTNK